MRKSIILFIMLFASYIHAEYQVEQILDIIQENKVQFVNFLFINLHGDIKEVTVPAHHVSNALKDGLAFDGSSIAGCANIAESDMLLKPDMDTFRIIPWLQGINKTAVIICDIWLNEDEPYPGDPRSLLKKLTHELNQMGLQFNVGPELEFFFVKKNNNTPCDTKCYWDIETDIQRSIQKSTILFLLGSFGINVEKLHHEVASGQHEISLRYNNAVSVADQLILAKYALKTIALQYDLRVTFMPKPFAGQNGSAMHIHFSLWDLFKNKNAFYHKDGLHQLSKTAEHFIAGILYHIPACTALLNPTINSFKRLVPGYEAPIYICWGTKNRSALIRIPQVKKDQSSAVRAELRCPDPSCNPYLAFAALLKAGLDGIEQKHDLPDAIEDNVYTLKTNVLKSNHITALPSSLENALEQIKQSRLMHELLGSKLLEEFVTLKNQEIARYKNHISGWELEQYL